MRHPAKYEAPPGSFTDSRSIGFPKARVEQVFQNTDSSNGKNHASDDQRFAEYRRVTIADPNQTAPQEPNPQSQEKYSPFPGLIDGDWIFLHGRDSAPGGEMSIYFN
jgi:hypothetical protein